MRYLIFLLFALSFGACQNESDTRMKVLSDQVPLRKDAGLKTELTGTLKKGEKVTPLGPVSSFESILEWQGKLLQTPWVKVETNGLQGWAPAALLSPPDSDYAAWFERIRMRCYFGDMVTKRREVWLQQNSEQDSDEKVARSYLEATLLRDTFMSILAARAAPVEPNAQLDYTWMGALLPGFILQKVPLRTEPYLFADYNFWLREASASQGVQDDQFFQFMAGIFPYDKVESFFPVWQFQLDDSKSASQLGTGVHAKLLAEIENLLPASPAFRPLLLQIRSQILDDIAGNNNAGYWQNGEKILAELSEIMELNLPSLTETDVIMLQTRYRMFEDPEANAIWVNLRSGE